MTDKLLAFTIIIWRWWRPPIILKWPHFCITGWSCSAIIGTSENYKTSWIFLVLKKS